MPGLVTPPEAPPPRVAVPDLNDPPISSHGGEPEPTPKPRSPTPRKAPAPAPSRSASRAKPSPDGGSSAKRRSSPAENPGRLEEPAPDNPDLGPLLLKLARDAVASGDSPGKALEYAIRAARSFERGTADGGGGDGLGLAMSLHLAAAIYCGLGRFGEAVAALERAIRVPEVEKGADHALAAFSGYMHLGDAHTMMGRVEQSIACYTEGLRIQMRALGGTDPRVAETCRVDDAIEILEHVLKIREEKLGTANPDADDEKKRLAELLKEAGRERRRRAKSLDSLIGKNSRRMKKEGTRRWAGWGFRT